MIDPRLHLEIIRRRGEERDRAVSAMAPQFAPARPEHPGAGAREPVTVRLAAPDDSADVRRLADLDSAPRPSGPLLIGERSGRAVAALALDDGAVVADPFVLTADVVALLRLRADQLRRGHRGLAASRRRRAVARRLVRIG